MSNEEGKAFWAHPIWETIHIIAAAYKYSPEAAKAFVSMLEGLMNYFLPCDKCRANLKKKLETMPIEPYLFSNHDLFFYTYMLHELANRQISQEHPDAPKTSPPYLEIKQHYFSKLGKECSECKQ
jgi:hypothetical protein